jgi:hypothetical protein
MDGKGNLLLEFLDVAGNKLADTVDVLLSHTVLSQTVDQRDFSAAKKLRITKLDSTQGGVYRLRVFPLRHRPVSRFVTVKEDETVSLSLALPIRPDRVREVKFPEFAALGADLQQVLSASMVEGFGNQQGQALYQALDQFQRAGLLNIYAKMKVTKFADGDDVFSFVTSLTRLRGDRFFAKVNSALRDEVKNSQAGQLFHEVSGALHTPPPDFVLVDSFKTFDPFGNLQLSFFNKPGTLEFSVDADIDDAQGIEHITQVLDHALTGRDTNPFDIHEILLKTQHLNPGYDLVA